MQNITYGTILTNGGYAMIKSRTCAFWESESKFGVPKVIISDEESHFYNRTMATLLKKYGVARSHH
ncbi:hypothetical protein CR513_12257, partial [Mucuna pruriens]